jgi:hypothetical protein
MMYSLSYRSCNNFNVFTSVPQKGDSEKYGKIEKITQSLAFQMHLNMKTVRTMHLCALQKHYCTV